MKATATETKLSDVTLAVGDSVWGYTAPCQRVCNTDWQETTTITRVSTRRYNVSCGGRPEGSGWQVTAYSMAQAILLSGFSPDAAVEDEKIKTVFDR